jgi:hypothetical protein
MTLSIRCPIDPREESSRIAERTLQYPYYKKPLLPGYTCGTDEVAKLPISMHGGMGADLLGAWRGLVFDSRFSVPARADV